MNAKALFRLTKPGVTYGNLLTTVAGYLFAAGGTIDWVVFSALTIGTWSVIASACVINNYLDRDIDAVMDRTKTRPLITGEVTPRQALLFGTALGIVGLAVLAAYTNKWVIWVGLLGWVTYVWFYGALGKRRSVHGTLVGALSGAAPILAGYVAAREGLDLGAMFVFAVLFFWQLPEFYSIAIYRKNEYSAAHIPLLSVVRGETVTIKHIFLHTFACVISILALAVFGYTGVVFSVVMAVSCAYWMYLAALGFREEQKDTWARRMFRYSLVILLVFSLMISIDAYLP